MRHPSGRTTGTVVAALIVLVAMLPGLTGASGGSAPTAVTGSAEGNSAPAGDFAAGSPNVLLITTDDQTLAEMEFLPQTQRLIGDAGATFETMLSPHPLCCPARAEILTGQYAQNNGVHTNGGPYGGWEALRDPDDTLGTWLQDSGYDTSLIGKFLNKWRPEEHGTPAGWSDFQTSPVDSFGYYDFSIYANGETTDYTGRESYSTDYVTDATVERIEDWSGQDRPFFVWASYYAPHGDCRKAEAGCKTPPTPADEYADEYADLRPPVYDKESFRAKPDRPNPIVRGRDEVTRGKARQMFLQRARSLISVDNGVARIVDALEDQGVLDDTLLLFTSDNGYLLGEHRYLGKVVGYEESLRVPLLMRGPGVEAGSTPRQVATTVDLAPTIVAAAGAEPGRTVDGRDLRAVVDGSGTAADTVLIQAGEQPNKASRSGKLWMFRGVRTNRYTYTVWVRKNGNRYVELFDNRRDPEQVDNLAGARRYRAVEKELRQRTSALKSCSGTDACFGTFGRVPRPGR